MQLTRLTKNIFAAFATRVLEWPMRTRIDSLNAILIDAIVSNHRPLGIRSAADALASNHISLEVALRVLTRPWQRRCVHTRATVFGQRIALD